MTYTWVCTRIDGEDHLSKWLLINQNTNTTVMALYMHDGVPDTWNRKLRKKLTHSYLWYLEKLVLWRVWNCQH